jgi:hypothetical protein
MGAIVTERDTPVTALREALHEAVKRVPWSTRTLPLYRHDILAAIDAALASSDESGERDVVWQVEHPPTQNVVADFPSEREAMRHVIEIGDATLVVRRREYAAPTTQAPREGTE